MGATMPRGRPPNPQRRRQIAELRAAGLTYEQIGKRLGISHQSVQQALQRTGNARRALEMPPEDRGGHHEDDNGLERHDEQRPR